MTVHSLVLSQCGSLEVIQYTAVLGNTIEEAENRIVAAAQVAVPQCTSVTASQNCITALQKHRHTNTSSRHPRRVARYSCVTALKCQDVIVKQCNSFKN